MNALLTGLRDLFPKSGQAGWFYAFVPHNIALGGTIHLTALFITRVLGGSVATVGEVSALSSLASAPASVFWGRLSDRLPGPRKFIVIGFLGFGIPALLMGLSANLYAFTLLSLALGFLAIASAPVSATLLMSTFARREWERQFGIFNQINGWGSLIGRLLGFLWLMLFLNLWGGEEMGMRGLFVICGLFSILAAALAWRWVPEPLRPAPQPPPASLWKRFVPSVERIRYLPPLLYSLFFPRSWRSIPAALSGRLGWYYLVSFLLFFGFLLAYTPYPIFLTDRLGASSALVFGQGMVNGLAAALAYQPMGRWAGKWGNARVLGASTAVRVVLFALFGLVAVYVQGPVGFWLVSALNTLSGVCWAAIAVAGAALVAELTQPPTAGRAMGLYNASILLAVILGSFLGGELAHRFGYPAAFFASSVAVALGTALLMPLGKPARTAGRVA